MSARRIYADTFHSQREANLDSYMGDPILQLCLPRRTPDRFYPGTDRPNRPGK